jgi:CRP-like cAMP-binding protein
VGSIAGTDDLARATARLRRHPANFAAWLEVAAIQSALGANDDAEETFAAIGEGARSVGRVALAVACARHLAERGSVHGPELVDAIVETYAAKTGRIVTAPPHEDHPPTIPEQEGDALAAARDVVAALAPWLAARPRAMRAPAPLLSALSQPGARALVGVMTARAVRAGATILERGAPATALYWIAHGTVSISRDGTELGELHSGAFFGEIALVGGTRRTATVVARDDAWLVEIPAKAVEAAAKKHPQLAEVLAFHARARLLANLVRTSIVFRALRDQDRDELLGKFVAEVHAPGTVVIREGAPNDRLRVVVAGTCQVRSAGGAIAELGAGAAIGEMSLVTGAAATADVVATEPTVLLALRKPDFDAVAARYPTLREDLAALARERDRENRALFVDATELIV